MGLKGGLDGSACVCPVAYMLSTAKPAWSATKSMQTRLYAYRVKGFVSFACLL